MLTLDPARQAEIVLFGDLKRRESIRVNRQKAGVVDEDRIGRAEVLRRPGLAVRICAKGVQFGRRGQVIAKVETGRSGVEPMLACVLPGLVVARRLTRICRRPRRQRVVHAQTNRLPSRVQCRIDQIGRLEREVANNPALRRELTRHAQMAAVAQGKGMIAANDADRTITFIRLTRLDREAAGALSVLQDDVDDACDGV